MQSSSLSFTDHAVNDCYLLVPERKKNNNSIRINGGQGKNRKHMFREILTLTCDNLTGRRSCQCTERHIVQYCCCSHFLGPDSVDLH